MNCSEDVVSLFLRHAHHYPVLSHAEEIDLAIKLLKADLRASLQNKK